MESTEKQNQEYHKEPKGLVEETLGFGIKHLGKNVLSREDKTGALLFPGRACALFSVERSASDAWSMSFSYLDEKEQFYAYKIEMNSVAVTFGKRPYFVCPACGSLRGWLYFNKGKNIACRGCLDLTYQSARGYGSPLDRMLHHKLKLDEKLAEVKRISYAGRLTRKARSAMAMSKSYFTPGVRREVEGYANSCKSHRI